MALRLLYPTCFLPLLALIYSTGVVLMQQNSKIWMYFTDKILQCCIMHIFIVNATALCDILLSLNLFILHRL